MKKNDIGVNVIVPEYNDSSLKAFAYSFAGSLIAYLNKNDIINVKLNPLESAWKGSNSINILVMQWIHGNYNRNEINILRMYKSKNAINILSGIASSVLRNYLIETSNIVDAILVGRNYNAIYEVIKRKANKQKIDGIPGLLIRSGKYKKASINQENYTLLDDRRYLKMDPTCISVPMNTSSICNNDCDFCIGNIYRKCNVKDKGANLYKKADKVVDEIEFIVEKFNKRIFYFLDDNFVWNRGVGRHRAIEICDEIVKRKLRIRFCIEVTGETLDDRLIKKLKMAGLYKVFIGLESGSPRALHRIGKRVDINKNIEAIGLLRTNNINVEAGFIFYDPFVNIDEMVENIEMIKKLSLCENNNRSLFNKLCILPGTTMESMVIAEGLKLGEKKHPILYNYGFRNNYVDKIYKTITFKMRQMGVNYDNMRYFTDVEKLIRKYA